VSELVVVWLLAGLAIMARMDHWSKYAVLAFAVLPLTLFTIAATISKIRHWCANDENAFSYLIVWVFYLIFSTPLIIIFVSWCAGAKWVQDVLITALLAPVQLLTVVPAFAFTQVFVVQLWAYLMRFIQKQKQATPDLCV